MKYYIKYHAFPISIRRYTAMEQYGFFVDILSKG